MSPQTLEYHNIKSILIEFTKPEDIEASKLLDLYKSKFTNPLNDSQIKIFLDILHKWKMFAANVYIQTNYQESFLDSFLNTSINGWD